MSKRQGWGLVILGLALGLGLWAWLSGGKGANRSRPAASPPSSEDIAENPTSRPKKADSTPAARKETPASFLETFGGKKDSDSEPAGPILSDAELEKRFEALLAIQDRAEALQEQFKGLKRRPSLQEFKAALAEHDQLEAQLNKAFDSLQKELVRARQARPDAAVPQWLTGELLMRVGGEADEVLPYLRRAVALGLSRPHLLASLAHAQTEANQLDKAYQDASKALALDEKDRYVWEKFTRAAFNVERFAEVGARLKKAFPDKLPDWAEPMQQEAQAQQALWQAELKLRAADAKANLPRLRLVIEHRRFARQGKDATSQIEVTGRDEIIVELFANQAPQAVADFLERIKRKVYEGKLVYAAEPARLAALGDPGSKIGSPPSELKSPGARGFFRGTLGIVTTGPPSAAVPFFITFVPMPKMKDHYLALGRVIQGQAGLERITLGRISRDVGFFGPTIPGDLLVRAEVLPTQPQQEQRSKDKVK
jgi:cyclophilin family peptidyl-prolyl cis-trans isomerase